MKTTYNGITKEISDNLFEPVKIIKNKPRKSLKFGTLSLYYEGKYYFAEKILPNESKAFSQPYKVEVVYFQGKWYQDTFYITEELKNLLEENL